MVAKKLSLYLDTSVIGGYWDRYFSKLEFQAYCKYSKDKRL